MSNNQELYKELCLKEDSIPLFLTFKWMNLVAEPNEWDVAIDQPGAEINGVWVYWKKKKLSMLKLGTPVLTPFSGIWYFYPKGQKSTSKISFEKEVTERLLKSLPAFQLFSQTFHPQITNWLPLYWNGFSQTTRYTYLLNTRYSYENIFSEFRYNVRRDIRNAEKSLKIETCTCKEIFAIKEAEPETFKDKLPYSFEYLNKIFSAAIDENWGAGYKAVDSEGQTHTVIFLVWDKHCMYYLVSATHPAFKGSCANTLLLSHAIKLAIEKGIPEFNFEGSMIKGVENFFRGFGGDLVPYHHLTKWNSQFLKFIESIRK